MKHQIIRCLGVACLLLSLNSYSQSVGIGTETPNSNAILELVAPDANQGLLVPRLSTVERTASSFTTNLSATDNGLLVYDSDEQKFYFWMTNQWVEIASGNIDALPDQSGQASRFLTTDGTNAQWSDIDFNTLTNIPAGLSDGDNDTQLSDADITALGYIKSADDADADAANEFQDLTLLGNTLSLTNSAASVDLSPFAGTNTDNQTLGLSGTDLSISGGNTIDVSSINTNLTEAEVDAFANNNGYLTTEVDGSTTNEIQDISTDGTAGDISLSSGSSLTLNVNDADASVTNEIQDISTTGAAGNITLSSGSTLNLNVDDADASATNEIELPTQIPADNGLFLQADGSGGVDYVAEVDGSTTNEIQDISTTGAAGNISLSSGSTLTLNVNDADASATNEIELPTQIPADNGLFLQADGSGGVDYVAEVDGSTTNETNTGMSLSGTTVQVTDANGTVGVDIGGTFATDTELAAINESQWTTNGTSINYTTGGVNIGSGTIPTSSLQLSTNNSSSTIPQLTIVESDATSDASTTFNNTGNAFTIGVDGSDEFFKISDANSLGSNDRFIIDNAGTVGIGTTPNAQFHVGLTGTSEGTGARITNSHSGGIVKIGIFNELDNQGSSTKTGVHNVIAGTASSAGTVRGVFNDITPTDGPSYGTSTTISNAGTGLRFGADNTVNGNVSNSSDIYGYRATLTHAGSGNTYAFFSQDFGSSSGTEYGVFIFGEDDNYLSGNLGIGESAPSAKLDVVGDTELNGQLTVTDDIEIPAANSYTYASAKTIVQSYHPTEFRIMNVAGAVESLLTPNSVNLYVYYAGGSGTGQAFSTAPVKLPDNAVVTQLDAWVVDNDATASNSFVRVSLTRNQTGTSNFNQTMAQVETNQATQDPSVTQLTDNTIFNAIIDNNTYSYYMRFTANDNSSELQLHGVKITYTITEVD